MAKKEVSICLRLIVLFLSSLIALVGLGIIGGGFYLAHETSFNQFVIIILLLGIVIAGLIILGMFFITGRPFVVILFMTFILLVSLFFITFGIVSQFKDDLIKEIVDKFKEEGDQDAGQKFTDALKNLKMPSVIGFISVGVVGLIDFALLICFRKQTIEVREINKREFTEGDDVLRSVKGGKDKREQIFDGNDNSLALY